MLKRKLILGFPFYQNIPLRFSSLASLHGATMQCTIDVLCPVHVSEMLLSLRGGQLYLSSLKVKVLADQTEAMLDQTQHSTIYH